MNLPFKKFKAFTLVELLIVIVIIGILMSALLPRLQGAQDLARDTARQTALSQLQTAIMSYRSLKGKWPSMESTGTSSLTWLVSKWFLTELPLDPIELAYTWRVWDSDPVVSVNTGRDFLYFVVKKNNQNSGAIVLATRVETDSRANYVSATDNGIQISGDFKNIFPCKSVEVNSENFSWPYTWWKDLECKAQNSAQLRYILKFS